MIIMLLYIALPVGDGVGGEVAAGGW